jgi:hypothetical protein
MEVSTKSKPYRDRRDAVDARLQQIYCIPIVDAGIEEKFLTDHWRSNEAPFEFVEWFAIKYDLDPMPFFVRPQERGGQR